MEQKENYAMLMRIAMLSSMQASYTSSSDGIPLRDRRGAAAMKRALLADARCLCLGRAAAPRAPAIRPHPLPARRRADRPGWHDARGLDVYRGHPVLVTMFYGSCPATCPLIIDTLRAIEQELDAAQRARTAGTADLDRSRARHARGAARAGRERGASTPARWTLARTDAATVRNIAALLNMQYRQLPNGEFNHSTVITLLSPQGEIEASSAKLGTPTPRCSPNCALGAAHYVPMPRRVSAARGARIRRELELSTGKPASDRRWGARVEVDLPVRLELSRGRSATGRMRNASVSGALIECALELPAFTQLRVEILAGAGACRSRSSSPPAWCAPSTRCLGVEWRDVAPQALTSSCCRRGLIRRSQRAWRLLFRGLRCSDGGAPDDVADVVGHQQRAALVERHAHGPAPGLALRRSRSR